MKPRDFAKGTAATGTLITPPTRAKLFVSGDLHAIGKARIKATGAIDLRRDPVVAALAGPLGATGYGWPSFLRTMRPQTPSGLEVEETMPATEENGS